MTDIIRIFQCLYCEARVPYIIDCKKCHGLGWTSIYSNAPKKAREIASELLDAIEITKRKYINGS